jgi:probable rRNA maturation factor
LISLFDTQTDLLFAPSAIEEMVSHLLENILKVSCDEVAIHLVDKEKISELHQAYFNDPTPTDCISFPIDETVLGEVFVCPAVACEYALKHKKDPYMETALYIIHGLLHLLGYDDQDPADRLQMQRKQQRCLKQLAQDEWIMRLRPCSTVSL